jgi:hypothetical protein
VEYKCGLQKNLELLTEVKITNMNELSSLESIAAHLEALVETIISRLLERAQFCENLRVYQPGQSGFTGESQRCLLIFE